MIDGINGQFFSISFLAAENALGIFGCAFRGDYSICERFF